LLTALLIAAAPWTSGCAAPGPRRQAGTAKTVPAKLKLPPRGLWLDSLDLTAMDQGWGQARAGQSVDGNPLTLNGRTYSRGIGTHAESELWVNLHGAAERFEALVGVDDEVGENGAAVFVVIVDGQEQARTRVLRGTDPPERVEADLAGAEEMILVVEDGGDGINYDHGDWAAAALVMAPGATAQPETIRPPSGPEPQIMAEVSPAPEVHAPRITGATPGRPFLFRIPATGAGPLNFTAVNLPAGLLLDPETGIITGALTEPGTTQVTLIVNGPNGSAVSTLTIVGGPQALALTPPMGWNSWNVWGTSVDDAKVRAAADMLVSSGLAAHGYQYINIDDAWAGERDADGRIQSNEKFQDMKALADYVHSLGLKLGVYSSPGPQTCAGYAGSYEHERLDAQTYAEWGIDLLKYDWCSYGQLAKDDSVEELRKPYEIMRAALDECGRDIVYSLCQYGMGRVSEWGATVGGNYWRTTGDITDTWGSLSGIGFAQAGLEEFAGPGHWNDPDMLVVGRLGWGPDLRPSRLNHNEQVTHLTLWSLLAAPLLIGCDLSQLDDFTLSVLTNPEVLEVNQDPLGRQAGRVTTADGLEVWSRPLVNGTLAVGLFNRTRRTATVTAQWSDLGMVGPRTVRDLWQRKDLGTFDGAYSAEVPRHGAVMLKIGVPQSQPAPAAQTP